MTSDDEPRSLSEGLARVLAEFEETRGAVLRLVMSSRAGELSDPEDDLGGRADGATGTGTSGGSGANAAAADAAVADAETELYRRLVDLRQLILENPAGASALVRFLVGEGLRHASTERGAAQYQAMIDSPEVERLRTVWEKVTLNLLDDEDDDEPVPSAWVELVRDLGVGAGLDRLAARLRPDGLT